MLTGALSGANVRKAEKARRLSDWLRRRRPYELWAYGDSSGDDELLAMADHPTWIGRRADPQLRPRAAAQLFGGIRMPPSRRMSWAFM